MPPKPQPHMRSARVQIKSLRHAGKATASTSGPLQSGGAALKGRQRNKQVQVPQRHVSDDSSLQRIQPRRPVAVHGVAAPLREAASSTDSDDAADISSSTVKQGVPLPGLLNGAGAAGEPDAEPRAGPEPVTVAEILAPVQQDMDAMNANLRSIVGGRHPLLVQAAEQIFGAGGKKLRPAIVFLVAHATTALMGLSDIVPRQRRLAEITEMIHTASLVHDDVLDECDTRRGASTVNSKFGTRIAVLTGDFLFAQSSWFLANLDNLEVIKLISQVIADFANGEISQAGKLFDTSITFQEYSDKSFYKTASLIAASCKSAAVFSGCTPEVKGAMWEYGRHLGLAFQYIDDILDFTQTEEQLGKPQGQDLASGNITGPVLFALQGDCGAELNSLIESDFQEEGGLQRAIAIVQQGNGVVDAQQLARQEADLALNALNCLPASPAKQSLELMVGYVLDRLF